MSDTGAAPDEISDLAGVSTLGVPAATGAEVVNVANPQSMASSLTMNTQNSGVSVDFQPGLQQTVDQAHIAMAQAISASAHYQVEAASFMGGMSPVSENPVGQVGHPGTPGGAGDIGEGGDYGGAGNSDY